jgi:hypothetical protein
MSVCLRWLLALTSSVSASIVLQSPSFAEQGLRPVAITSRVSGSLEPDYNAELVPQMAHDPSITTTIFREYQATKSMPLLARIKYIKELIDP